ncbi:MAG: hypothetical protein MZV70_77440 [Desulfobacterales bacterium]|nr:hypothetical protein [Desulfobacterales bacterium]
MQIRGVVESVSIKETLELIRDLFPDRVKLAVITDGSITGQADLKTFLSAADSFPFKTEYFFIK